MLSTDFSPEQNLCVAILKDALDCLKIPLEREKAIAFFLSESIDYPMSYANICRQLFVDDDIIRTKVLDWINYGKDIK